MRGLRRENSRQGEAENKQDLARRRRFLLRHQRLRAEQAEGPAVRRGRQRVPEQVRPVRVLAQQQGRVPRAGKQRGVPEERHEAGLVRQERVPPLGGAVRRRGRASHPVRAQERHRLPLLHADAAAAGGVEEVRHEAVQRDVAEDQQGRSRALQVLRRHALPGGRFG